MQQHGIPAFEHDPAAHRKRHHRHADLRAAGIFRLAAGAVRIYHSAPGVSHHLAQPQTPAKTVRPATRRQTRGLWSGAGISGRDEDHQILRHERRAFPRPRPGAVGDEENRRESGDGRRRLHVQRQRISIARALLKNAPIILLDEATASLDPENEVLVQKALAKLVEGKTVVMIAHRLRTVADADQILVLENGELVEQGTHAALMEKHGLYQRLYAIQQESLGWSV